MERGKFDASRPSELGLQIVPQADGIEVVFTVSDGDFADLSEAKSYFEDEIDSETVELRKLQLLMGLAGLFQGYQIYNGIRDDNPGAILPIAVVAVLMFYVRNKSMRPTIEKRNVAKKKLGLLEDYESSLSIEETTYESF